ncbi:MAG: hypothetical protein JWR80_10003 [Bradyrhizobium sp.]|nr:hypothetical protein [Bradyrhizobium sp.]
MSEKVDLTFIPITGPGVDAFEARKETGSKVEITEQEMRDSYERVKHRVFAGIKQLRLAAIRRIHIPRS